MKHRNYSNLPDKSVTFVNPKTGEYITHNDTTGKLPVYKTKLISIVDLLDISTDDIIMLVGKKTDLSRDWFNEAREHDWVKSGIFDYRSFSFVKGDKIVDVRHSSSWFPNEIGTISEIRYSWLITNKIMIDLGGMSIVGTPATTGKMFLEHTMPYNSEIPEIYDDIKDVLLSYYTQARKEVIDHDNDNISEFYYSDGRWMYAASSAREMPVGKGRRETTNIFEKYSMSFYRATITIPDDWNHIGLIAEKQDDGESWTWPNIPNYSFECWVWEPELRVAIENNWRVEIHERVFFNKGRHLRKWREKIIEMREKAEVIQNVVIRKNVQSAFREIMLHTIGSFIRGDNKDREIEVHKKDWSTVSKSLHTEDVSSATRVDDLMVSVKRAPLTEKQRQYYRPQISLYIWSYCRMMLAKTMLEIDYNIIIGNNTDAIYTTKNPHLLDDGKVGMFRLKGCLHKECKSPKNNAEMSLIKDLSEKNMKGCNHHGK